MTVEARPTSAPTLLEPDAKRADIQGLRAIAVLLVVTFHARLPVPAGFAGVDIFFVISGFVITGQIQRRRSRNDFSFSDFYARRIRRLLPAMVTMLAVVLVLSFFLESPLDAQPTTAETATAAVLLLGNFAVLWTGAGGYFDPAATSNPLLHVWSLSVEEQFYLFFPLVLVLAARRGRRTLVVSLSICTLLSLALALRLTSGTAIRVHGVPFSEFAFYSSPTRAWEFGAGALLALWSGRLATRPGRVRQRSAAGLAVAGVGGLVAAQFLITDRTPWPGSLTTLPVLATVTLIAAGTLDANPVSRVLAHAWMTRVGDLSYSIYLWHWPVIVLATLIWPRPWVPALAAVVSLGPAWLSYHYVETPWRRREPDRRGPFIGGAAATASIVVLALGLGFLSRGLIPGVSAYRAEMHRPTLAQTKGCLLSQRDYHPDDIERCTVRVPHAKGWILLAGDSHAAALSDGVVEAASESGYDTVTLQGAGCAFTRSATSRFLPNCGELSSDLLDRAVGANPPAMVIMSHRITYRLTDEPDWVESLRPTLDELHRSGVPVLYVLDVPNYAPPAAGVGSSCRGGWLLFDCTRSQDSILGYQGVARAQELRVIGSEPGVRTLDPWPTFCHRGTCSSLLNGHLAYENLDHLNAIGSEALAPQFKEAIAIDARR